MDLKRTDLALEAHEMLMETAKELLGIDVKNETKDDIQVTKITITNDETAKKLGKEPGTYITLELSDVRNNMPEDNTKISRLLSKELKALIKPDKKLSVLVTGLGNRFITPDALGPKVISDVFVTRHLSEVLNEDFNTSTRNVCAIAPGVLGITGIETVEIIKSIVDRIKPNVVIAIDALASRSVKRIASTIQISDAGISPGAGVGNNRKGLNKDYLGIPVIAIGVPTVINAVTITSDTIESMRENMNQTLGVLGSIAHMEEDERYNTIQNSIENDLKNFIVTPKDIDILIDKTSKILADGINLAMHENLSLEDINAYMY